MIHTVTLTAIRSATLDRAPDLTSRLRARPSATSEVIDAPGPHC